ncbi:MAG: hypothetical protein AAF512_04135 [Pseudomonadota bacterium]
MNGLDVLLTLAQIGVAFAGFSSIIAIFSGHDERWLRIDIIRMVSMLSSSLLATLLAVIPTVINLQIPDPVAGWRIAGIIYCVGLAVLLLGGFFYGLELKRLNTRNIFFWSHISMLLLAFLLQAATLSGILSLAPAASYTAGVLLLLMISGVNFFRLVFVNVK